ncbi:phosphoesterase [Carbonactinospora thermoautotrophica]|uniref:PHP domain protein n=2 Tax=Carbonactinospora thermoautotrophica TaxID=1469144 RepID=A0A132MNI6_9ACTN|nr:PHP domain-containing protein [Carbonactinospora thermoautotrophica]KWW99295.1 PHP domain protein [Carbonactinospora thermoautotrophica]KWX04945.1 phosphoesterase [Carbonactinospora thermoautotrophica]
MRIDLHAHSTASDGADTPSQLVRRAREAGLDVLALTDHDTVSGLAEATAVARETGITLVPGAEISCSWRGISIHMLAYLFDPGHAEFARERDLLRDDRTRRGRAIVERCRELGAPITWERVREIAGDGAVGRPHIARALVEAGVVATIQDAFSPDWIADNGRAYVEKYTLEPTRAIELIRAAGGVAVFAHPGARKRGRVVGPEVIAELAAAGMAGIEVDHPDHDEDTREELRGLAKELGLLVTGSSDYHGSVKPNRLGENTTDPAVYEEIVARATGTGPVIPTCST